MITVNLPARSAPPRSGAIAPVFVTPTRQPIYTTARLVSALEAAWSAIRSRHPEVPAVVVVVASGSPKRAAAMLTLGHFAASRWQYGDTRLAEVMVSGEGLARSAPEVLATLLHEAAHGLAHAHNIKDTSRQGRWHNHHFKTIAEQLGLAIAKDPKIGWSVTAITDATVTRYTDVLVELAGAMSAYRHCEPLDTPAATTSRNGVALECGCPRKIRVSLSVHAEGPIICGLCNEPFTDPDPDPDAEDTPDGDGEPS
jgi:hypothetical protein